MHCTYLVWSAFLFFFFPTLFLFYFHIFIKYSLHFLIEGNYPCTPVLPLHSCYSTVHNTAHILQLDKAGTNTTNKLLS